MAWEKRGNRMYFYKSVRYGKRVRKIYFGGGVLGQIAEAAIGPREKGLGPGTK